MALNIMINVALDGMGMAVIATLLLGMYLSNQMSERRGRIVVLLLGLIFLQQACDMVNWLCEGKPAYAGLLLLVNCAIFVVADLTALVFCYYAISLIGRNSKGIRRLLVVLVALCAVFVVMNLLNLRTEMFYGVDDAGCYYRAPLYLVTHIYHFAVMIVAVWIALREPSLSSRHKLALFTYAFMPFAAVVFQVFVYGLSAVTYCAMTLSMLLIFITVHLRSVAKLEQADRELTKTRRAYLETLNSAVTDDLTGVLVRKVLVKQVEDTLSSQRSTGCSLWMLDLDRFKDVNDQFGHAMGDEVLKAVAERLDTLFPQQVSVARYGGDEFCVFLPQVTLEETYQYLRYAIAALNFVCESGGKQVKVMASIGAAFAAPDSAATCESLFTRADEALYHSKNNGRGQYSLTEM